MAVERSFAARVARAFLFSGVGQITAKGIFLVSLLAVLRRIQPEEFGLASIVLAIFAITEALNELGLGPALIQRKEIKRSEIDALFILSLGLSALIYIALALGAPLLASFYDEPELTSLVRVYGLSLLFFPLFFVPRNLLMKRLAFGKLAIADNLSLTMGSLVMLVLGFRGLGPWAIILGDLTHRFGQLVLCNVFSPYLPSLRGASYGPIGKMVKFGVYVTGSRLLYNFYTHADYLIVGKVFGTEALGVYTLAYRLLSDPIKTLATIVNQVAYPTFAALQDQLTRLRLYFFTIARFSMMLIGTIICVVVVFVDWLLVVGGYEPYLEATPLVRLMALAGLIRTVAPLVPQLLNAADRAKRNFYYSAAMAVVMPGAFLLGAQFGLVGVAASWSLLYPVVVLVLFGFGAQVLDISLVSFLGRLFEALPRLLPVIALTVGLRAAMIFFGAGDSPLVGSALLLLVLLVGVGIVWLFERGTLQTVLRRGN